MEDLVALRVMFAVGLVVMTAAASLLALGLERLASAIRQRGQRPGRARTGER